MDHLVLGWDEWRWVDHLVLGWNEWRWVDHLVLGWNEWRRMDHFFILVLGMVNDIRRYDYEGFGIPYNLHY